MKSLKVFITSALLLFMSMVAFADEAKKTISIREWDFTVREGETKTINLSKKMFVHKLFIQAVSGNRNDSYAEVYVNGDVKGTLYLPGVDPHYVVTIADKTDSIQFTSIENRFKILSVKAVVSELDNDYFDDYLPLPSNYYTSIGKTSARILAHINRIADYTSYRNYGQYILPIRKSAIRAIAIAETNGDASEYARPYFQELLRELENAEDYLNHAIEMDAVYDLVLELMIEKETLRRSLM